MADPLVSRLVADLKAHGTSGTGIGPTRTATRPYVYIPELAQLRRDLKAVEPALLKEIQKSLKAAAEVVASDARSRTPVRTGRLRQSIKATTAGSRAIIRAKHSVVPYGNFIEWGGTTGRGHTTHTPGAIGPIEGRHMISDAIAAKGDEATRLLHDNLDAVFRRHGWR